MRLTIKYHDLVLLGILLSLLTGAAVGYFTALPTAITVPVAAIAGILLIYHTLFLRGPVNAAEELSEEVGEIELGK